MSNMTRIGKESENDPIKSIMGLLMVIIFGMFMVVLDATALNVMLPSLNSDFNSSYNTVQWTVTAYTLAQAAVVPIAGWMTERFGTKRIYLICIGIFAVGSLLCALSTSIKQLILFRILQGLGGGMVLPIAFAFTYRIAPPGKTGAVMGIVTAPMLLAPALGPVLSGWMVDYITWHWVFLINIPIGAVTILVGIRKLPKMGRQSVGNLDMLGIILAPLVFSALCYGISEGGSDWGSPTTLIGLSVGGFALLLFVISQLRRQHPLLELRVFRSMNFTRGILVQWVAFLALYGSSFLIPQFLQHAKGYTAFETGLTMSAEALTSALVIPIASRFFDKFGARPLAIAGMGSVAVSALIFSQTTSEDGLWMILIALIMLGAGVGLSMMPINTHLLQSAPKHLSGRVSALTGAMQQVMTSFAVAGSATILMSNLTNHLASVDRELKAWSSAFGNTFLVIMSLAIVGTVLALFIQRPKQISDPDEEKVESEVGSMGDH
ncbi:DHA2 family efflux MFS transporter permease subunit [Virgibacillus salexigens]|uniref:DHA2 family efflux MFS transporter permease subunit n=1 Tax=Virgibacillus salexigens TaxID=61016 RepID=UPI001F267EBA|nr:DHA2 family efflux MFS transporter permease subunit [Virgibacillus salexigens]